MRRRSILSLMRQFNGVGSELRPQARAKDVSAAPGRQQKPVRLSASSSALSPATALAGSPRRSRRLPPLLLGAWLVSLLLIGGCVGNPLMAPKSAPATGPLSATGAQVELGQQDPRADVMAQYRIGPQDVLDISVLEEKDLSARMVVGPDGWIAFPMAGQVQAAGKTVTELGEEISARLSDKIRDPMVSVAIAEPAGYQVYVVGKVNKPGQFVVGRQIDVLQSLALAGGLTPFADQNDIKVLRQGGGGKADRIFPFDYGSIKRGQNLRQNIVLQSGDVVVVP